MSNEPRRKIVSPVLGSLLISLAFFGGVFFLFAKIANFEFAAALSAEDGAIEMFGAACFFIVAAMQLWIFFNTRLERKNRIFPFLSRNVFVLGLAGMFFFAFGEEISWGQRLFGWETPEALRQSNQQEETNIHNLALFHGSESLLNMSRLFNLFWLGFCVVLPILWCVSSLVNKLCSRVSLPVPPVWVAGLFLGCFISFRIYTHTVGTETLGNANELKESLLAFCFLLMSAAQLNPTTVREQKRATLDLGRRQPSVESPA